MTDRLWVGTRKGLFPVTRDAGGRWLVGTAHFLGDPVTYVLRDPRDGTLYAALNLGHFGSKLRRSTDGGTTWAECAVPTYPKQPESRASEMAWKLQLLWTLAAGGANEPGRLWAGTIPGGLFRSDDRGDSWHLNESLWERPERPQWQGGGYDGPGIHSILVDPRNAKRMLIGISSAGVWETTDSGASWQTASKGLRAAYMPPELAHEPNAQDPHSVQWCPTAPDHLWMQHHNGIFTSADGAREWHEIERAGPSVFGFACAVHPTDSNTAWFVPAVKDETRVPVDGRLVVTRTVDGGKSFDVLANGLPPAPAYDLVYRHGLAIDATGRRLAMGSTTGSLWVTENSGDHWHPISTHLPPIASVCFG